MTDPTSSQLSTVPRRQFLRLGLVTAAAAGLGSQWPLMAQADGRDRGDGRPVPPHRTDAAVARAWFDQALTSVQATPGFTPPVAARLFGYAGIALYESLVPGMTHHRSLAGQLDGLVRKGLPRGPVGDVRWSLVANAALAGTLRRMLPPNGPTAAAIDALEHDIAATVGKRTNRHVERRSAAYGDAVADAICTWSRTDGGHEGYLRNFPPGYVPPVGPGLWQPTPPAFQRALQPTWGTNRTMIRGLVAAAASAPPLPYSEDPGSAFYAEAIEVYDTVNAAVDEQVAIASFWSDDPGLTATPPGHSISILSQFLTASGADLGLAAEAYARLGIALSDAFVCCWHTKYLYNLVRPITFVRTHIDGTWGDPLPLTTPPFPEHTSGHSVQSGAMARVLTELFGPIAFTDHTHDGRGLPPRTFDSFDAAAAEAAISRLYGGIHYRHAIEAGLAQGAAVGDAVNALRMHR